jgi:peptide/nickel transport system permease protein
VTKYITVRLGQLIPVLFGISLLVFSITHLVPGDAVDILMGTQVSRTEAQVQELRRLFGLDQPVYVQYVNWLGGILQGDFGVSLRTARPVAAEILQRLPVSAQLATLALITGVTFGVLLGVVAAVWQGSGADRAVGVVALIGLSIPDFWLATLIILFSSLYWPVIEIGTYVPFFEEPLHNLKLMLPPALAFSAGLVAIIMRFTRTSMLEVLHSDYVRTARSKGLAENVVIAKHVLRNALLPVITVVGFYAGYLLGGTVVIEEIFAIPGMGRLTLQAISQRDYPLIQGIVLVVALLFVLINLLVDIVYAWLNPRINYE